MALQDHAVGGHGLALPNDHHVAHGQSANVNLHFNAVPDDVGLPGRQVHQPGDGLAGAALGLRLQVLAHGDQRGDHHAGVEVIVRHGHALAGVQLQRHAQQHRQAVAQARRRAHADQAVHVGGQVKQRPETVYKVVPVDDDGRDHQQQLYEAVEHGPVQCRGHRQMQHVAHRHVHQRDQQREGGDQPVAHGLQFGTVVGPFGLLRGSRSLAPWRGAVAAGGHRLADGVRGDGGGIELDLHRVGQQAHRHVADALQLAHALLHMGAARRAGHALYIECHRYIPYYLSFFISSSVSSMMSGLPFLTSSTTQFSIWLFSTL